MGLLLANYLVVSAHFATTEKPRVAIPYQPTFIAHVRDGNVAAISAKAVAIKGTFERRSAYPDAKATVTTDFSTEVPAYVNTDALDRLLAANGVEVTAKPTTSQTPLWLTVLLYFGRRCCPSACGSGTCGARAPAPVSSPSGARRRSSASPRRGVAFADVAGIDEAEQELEEVARAHRARRRPQARAQPG